jgi:hypothetical protein
VLALTFIDQGWQGVHDELEEVEEDLRHGHKLRLEDSQVHLLEKPCPFITEPSAQWVNLFVSGKHFQQCLK